MAQLPDIVREKLPRNALLVRVGAGAAVVGGLALAAPIIWGAASASLGLLVVGALGVVGLGAVQAIPLLGQKWENRLLAARKAEARENPIEQLQNFFRG